MNFKQVVFIFSFAFFALNNLHAMQARKKNKTKKVPIGAAEAAARNLQLMGALFGIQVKLPILEQLDEVLQACNNTQKALGGAVQRGYAQIIPLLIARGAEAGGNSEEYLLNIASTNGDVDVVKALIQSGARVRRWALGDDIHDGEGWLESEDWEFTPLETAVKRDRFEVVKLLCKHAKPKKGSFKDVWQLLGCTIEGGKFDIAKELFFASVGLFSYQDMSDNQKAACKQRMETCLCVMRKFLPKDLADGVLFYFPEYVADSDMLAKILSYNGHQVGGLVQSCPRSWCQDVLKSTHVKNDVKDAVKMKVKEAEIDRATRVCEKMRSRIEKVLKMAGVRKTKHSQFQQFFDPNDPSLVREEFMSARCDEMFDDE